MKLFKKIMSYTLVAVVASGATMLLSFFATNSKLDNLIWVIDRYYVDPVDWQAVEDAAANAIVDALPDRWSYYISAADYEDYADDKNNAYVGVGIVVQEDEKGFRILKVEEGGGAAAAGLQAGDVVIRADGQDVAGWTVTQVRDAIRGEENTAVELVILRGEEQLTAKVQRFLIQRQVATGRMLEGNIGYIRIENFNTGCAEQTIARVQELQEQGAVALVFDVRNNGGGYQTELVAVLDYLLPEMEVFHAVDYRGKEEISYSDAACVELPMAVLINPESYSAAEFFAAALRVGNGAPLVGRPTVGKSHYQLTYDLGDGSAIALSVGKYYTPDGVCLEDAGGLTPDVTVEITEEQFLQIYAQTLPLEEDPQLLAAVEALQ